MKKENYVGFLAEPEDYSRDGAPRAPARGARARGARAETTDRTQFACSGMEPVTKHILMDNVM